MAELILMDEEERAVKAMLGKFLWAGVGGVPLMKVWSWGSTGAFREEQSSRPSWSKVCEARMDDGGSRAQPHCQVSSGSQLSLPPALEAAGRLCSELHLEGSLWGSGEAGGQAANLVWAQGGSHGRLMEGRVRIDGQAIPGG